MLCTPSVDRLPKPAFSRAHGGVAHRARYRRCWSRASAALARTTTTSLNSTNRSRLLLAATERARRCAAALPNSQLPGSVWSSRAALPLSTRRCSTRRHLLPLRPVTLLPPCACCRAWTLQTIIECLRQACTGELPPNVGGNGRNWVMDPKVCATGWLGNWVARLNRQGSTCLTD